MFAWSWLFACLQLRWFGISSSHTRFEDVLMSCYIGFVEKLIKTKKSLLGLIFSSCSSDISFMIGQNLDFLLRKYRKVTVKELTLVKRLDKNARVYPLQCHQYWKVNLVEEISLIQVDLRFQNTIVVSWLNWWMLFL